MDKELLDKFAAAALANPALCPGTAAEYKLRAWFGEHRTGITNPEIAAKQAYDYAEEMLKESAKR